MRFQILVIGASLILGCVQPAPASYPSMSPPSASSMPSLIPSSASLAVLRLEPAFPCGNGTIVATGTGFHTGKVNLEFQSEMTRHSIITAVVREVVADANGTFRYEFSLQDPELELLRPGARTWLRAFEQGSQRAEVPIPVCNQGLETALTAPTIPFDEVIRGERDVNPPLPGDLFETAIVHSQEELATILGKYGFNASAIALVPRLSFDRQVGLLSLTRPAFRSHRTEIVAVTPQDAELVVHTVDWLIPSPLFQSVSFHYIAIPRTSQSMRFAPLAHGYSTQRSALKPALEAHKPPVLYMDAAGEGKILEAGW